MILWRIAFKMLNSIMVYRHPRGGRFCQSGIKPWRSRNDFSITSAFYMTNDLGHAFEHPLHNHP